MYGKREDVRTHTYTYDDHGNRLQREVIATGETLDYEWDARNRLVGGVFTDGSGVVTKSLEYTYDMYNRRLSKKVFDGSGALIRHERYVWDPTALDGKGNVVLDFVDGSDGNETVEGTELDKRYLWGAAVDQLLAQEDISSLTNPIPDDVVFALADSLGSIRDLVHYDTTSGTTVSKDHRKFETFGDAPAGDFTVSRYGHTAQEYDEDLDAYYSDHRWYDPKTGRFLSPDPIKDDFNNTYRPVGNDPVNRVDPTGLQEVSVELVEINTSNVKFSQNSVGSIFSDGYPVREAIGEAIRSGANPRYPLDVDGGSKLQRGAGEF